MGESNRGKKQDKTQLTPLVQSFVLFNSMIEIMSLCLVHTWLHCYISLVSVLLSFLQWCRICWLMLLSVKIANENLNDRPVPIMSPIKKAGEKIWNVIVPSRVLLGVIDAVNGCCLFFFVCLVNSVSHLHVVDWSRGPRPNLRPDRFSHKQGWLRADEVLAIFMLQRGKWDPPQMLSLTRLLSTLALQRKRRRLIFTSRGVQFR